jgi:hypothetical protein
MLVLTLAVAGVGCPCARSAINSSTGIRWWLFSNFGASKMCPEMLARGVPLKLSAFGNASIGRFFPATCRVDVDDPRHVIVMTATGTGYVSLPVTQRMGFFVAMTVEYAPDFRLEDDATYVWGRFGRFVAPPDLRVLGVENPVVSLATKTPFGDVATVIGNGLVASEIGRGFTVVRQEDGDDFTLGHLDPPARPQRQMAAMRDRFVLASDLTSVRPRAREYLGPFRIDAENASLHLRAKVDGAPLSFTVVERSVGDRWRQDYEAGKPLGPAPGTFLGQGQLPPGEARLAFPLPPGSYYVVLQNDSAPAFAPMGVALTESVAYASYLAEVGERR